MVRLPGHDLLTGKVGAFYKRKREGGRSGRSAKRVGRTEPMWMIERRAVLRQEAGLVTLRVRILFLARRRKWDEKVC